MLSQLDTNLTRDRNLNFKLSDANSMQILDNQAKSKDASRTVAKFSSSSSSSSNNKKEEAARRKEYDNYINTFTGSNKNDNYKPSFQPPRVSSRPQDGSSTTAYNKAVKKTSSIESPGTRKLIRTPTQESRFILQPSIKCFLLLLKEFNIDKTMTVANGKIVYDFLLCKYYSLEAHSMYFYFKTYGGM